MMFIILTKKQLKKLLLLSLNILFAIILISALGLWNQWVIHDQMPQPDLTTDDWRYQSVLDQFTPAIEGYSVLVDLDRQVLILYESAKEIKEWPASGGRKKTPSPTGSWIVTDVGNWGEGFGGSYIALNVPWGKYGIHGTVEPWIVGSNNVSHGCIRMKNTDVAELKKYISKGVPVYIKYDNTPFRVLVDGKVGSDVLKLQVMLKQLGYYNGTPDGRFGKVTQKALCLFQTDEQIQVDGIAGQHTWSLLQERILGQK